MTTVTLDSPSTTGSLEFLVDRLLATLFRDKPEQGVPASGLVKAVHEARRLRQSGDLDGALEAFNGIDIADTQDSQLRWLYSEWLDIARRRFTGCGAMIYSPAAGRAAVLVPTADGNGKALEVAVVLGMRWPLGKTVSQRSLRGLKPLVKGDS